MFQVKKDPSDSPTFKKFPCSVQGCGFFGSGGNLDQLKCGLNKTHPSVPCFTEGKFLSRASQAVDRVFVEDIHPCLTAREAACSYPAGARQGFTQADCPGGTAVDESSCAVANQGPVCATNDSWKPFKAHMGRASTYNIPSEYTTEVH